MNPFDVMLFVIAISYLLVLSFFLLNYYNRRKQRLINQEIIMKQLLAINEVIAKYPLRLNSRPEEAFDIKDYSDFVENWAVNLAKLDLLVKMYSDVNFTIYHRLSRRFANFVNEYIDQSITENSEVGITEFNEFADQFNDFNESMIELIRNIGTRTRSSLDLLG